MRVLVTGASGQVGQAIARHLHDMRHEPVGLCRRPCAAPFEQIAVELGVPGSLENVRNVLGPCEAIVHAAASLDMRLDAEDISRTNCWGTQQVVALASAWDVRSLIFISSVPVVGKPRVLPITEEHPCAPLTAYHASKLYGETLTLLAATEKRAGTILRLTAPVGPGMARGRLLSRFVALALDEQPLTILGQGTRRQNYVDVRDVAGAVGLALAARSSGVFNIAGRRSISNADLARVTLETLGARAGITFSETPDPEEGVTWDVAIDKAARVFGYEPQHDLADSIRAVAAELRSMR